MKNRARKIVIGGVFSALVIVLGISGLGFIPLPTGSITIIHVPVIVAAILEGPVVGFFCGLLFGIFSIVQAGIIGVSPVDLAFLHYPWIAIVPRILIGPLAWLVYSLISGTFFARLRKNKGTVEDTNTSPTGENKGAVRETAALIIGAITGSLTNTVLVLSAFSLILPEIFTRQVLLTLISLNGTLEAAFSAIITLAVLLSWKGISRRGKSRLSRSISKDE